MTAESRSLNRTAWVIIVVVMLAAIIARALPGPRTIDDAFITFRYSRNIVEGQGFVYNPGVHTLGTTTPLFTLLMVAASALTGGQDFQLYAIAVSAAADAFTAVLLYLLARRFTGSDFVGALPGLLWAVSPRSVTFAVGGMETSVAILWMVAAVWSFVHGHERLTGLFAALGFLTRIDALLWIAPLLLYQLVERSWARQSVPLLQRLPLQTWISGALVALPWLAFALFYFGSPIPNSISAKTVAYVLPPGAAFVTFIQAYSTPFFEFDTFGSLGAMAGALIYLILSVVAIVYAARRLPRLLPFLIYPFLYLLVFS